MALQWVGAAWKAIHEICLVCCGVFVHNTPQVTLLCGDGSTEKEKVKESSALIMRRISSMFAKLE
jgi:hypothetical protein